MTKLSKDSLLDKVVSGLSAGGWSPLVLDPAHPFRLRAFRDDGSSFDVRAYIWNCTHGGGAARAKDEFRIQFTGTVPVRHAGERAVLLGWHDEKGVFAAWDLSKHDGQASASPSAQVKEAALDSASQKAFATHVKDNGEIVVAFRPEFLADYILGADALHASGKAHQDLSLLNKLDTLTDAEIESIENQERRVVVRTIARKYRAHDFRRRVLGAYVHRCALCGIQLALIDAAHILPVQDPKSTDEIVNGIAMCKLHHSAFDRNLLSVNEHYKIEVSKARVAQLQSEKLSGGIDQFRSGLHGNLLLPPKAHHHPRPAYLRAARVSRRWQP